MLTFMQEGIHYITWEKYSSITRNAQSLQVSRGRAGLETSAHLISIRFRIATFSGELGMSLAATLIGFNVLDDDSETGERSSES